MSIDEVLNVRRHIAPVQVATPSQLLGDVVGHVLRPSFERVEADNPDRIAVVTRQQFADDAFKVGVFVGFPPDAAEPAKIIQNQVDVLIFGHAIEGVRLDLRMHSTPRYGTGI